MAENEEEYDQQCRLVVQGVRDALRDHPQDTLKPSPEPGDPKSTQSTFDVLVLDALHRHFSPEVLVPVLDFLLPSEPRDPPFVRMSALMERVLGPEPALQVIRLMVQSIMESLVRSPHRLSFARTYEMLHWKAPSAGLGEQALRVQRSDASALGLPPGVLLVGEAAAEAGVVREGEGIREKERVVG